MGFSHYFWKHPYGRPSAISIGIFEIPGKRAEGCSWWCSHTSNINLVPERFALKRLFQLDDSKLQNLGKCFRVHHFHPFQKTGLFFLGSKQWQYLYFSSNVTLGPWGPNVTPDFGETFFWSTLGRGPMNKKGGVRKNPQKRGRKMTVFEMLLKCCCLCCLCCFNVSMFQCFFFLVLDFKN